MEKKARTAGILSIVSGALGIIGCGLFLLIMLVMVNLVLFNKAYTGYSLFSPNFRLMLNIVYSVSFLYFMLFGVLGVVGGVFAVKRKQWGIALAGAIASMIAFFPCGVAATVLIIRAYNEYLTNYSLEVKSYFKHIISSTFTLKIIFW